MLGGSVGQHDVFLDDFSFYRIFGALVKGRLHTAPS